MSMFPVVDTRNPVIWTQASFEEVGLQSLVTAVTGNTPLWGGRCGGRGWLWCFFDLEVGRSEQAGGEFVQETA